MSIASALLTDAALRNMKSAIIVSADSDMVPAVIAAQKIYPQLFIAAAFPPRRKSHHLRSLMPASFPIDPNRIVRMQLPNVFTVGTRTFTRPQKWQ